jgi:DNA-binding SARP family transcriptional activator/ABC-type glycerol-3-phosphate transport system substrate-binding protein
MRFKVLGPLEVSRDDGPIQLGGPKQRAVLAHLLVRVNELVPADVLIDQVWGDEPPDAARGTLHSYISHLRKALGAERIEGRAPGYVLHVAEDELDSARFERLLHEARLANESPGRAGATLREALALWTGPAFADLSSEPSLAAEIARLEELRLQALEERIAADLAEGRHSDVIGELEALTRELPLRERLWELLMLALYRSRRPADALAAFERARDRLARELGADPSPELRRLHERILREDPDLDLGGEPLRGYRLLEQVGEGAFGVVYRAIQPQVGREVAIKAVHPELANHPDFVRRFDHEAQIVARLEHPHVVPLYDYWREPNAAYLVMRFLRGGSVEGLLETGPLDPTRVVSITEQVASALGAAHRQGVVHRDVKPGNVLLDEEGNAYLTDFGVALDAGSPERSSGTMMRGTPAYLSPEQIRLQPAGPQSDVYALGIVVYEMLTGDHPFPEQSLRALLDHHVHDALPSVRDRRPHLPGAVDEVIARATAKDPKDRFPDIQAIATGLRAVFEGTRVARGLEGPVRNPYKGLRAFLEADAVDFFGREAVTKRLVQALADDNPAARFLAVVGPSGSGKSSVVRAGLLPALRRGAIPGSERWYVIDVVPGHRPFREIETGLMGIAVEPPPSLMEELEGDELGLVRAVDRVLPDSDTELVIVLDQFEEVFTLVDDEAERSHLLQSLRAAALEPQSRVRVVATLRADFYDAPLSVPGFGDLLAARTEAVTPMTPEELERAIVAPADGAGLVVEPRLLAEMIADVADHPGALPLLQYALTELAERTSEGVLTLDAYRKIGRVSGALARRAEQLFEPMNSTGREACRQLFLRLVTLGEGTEDTRRRVRRSELLTLVDARAMDGVIETFGRHRLLSFDRDPDTREPTVEIAHEALLREWARLRSWVDEARDQLRLSARVSAAAVEWTQAGRNDEYLLSGTRLAQAEEAGQSEAIRLTDSEREYVDASVARREAQRGLERARHARELSLERRARGRLRGLVAVLAAGLLAAASLTAVAVNRTREAERRRDQARVTALSEAVLANLQTDPELSLLLALHAVSASLSIDEAVPAGTVEGLHLALQANRVQYPVADAATAVIAGPAGRTGVFALPVRELVDLARAHAAHVLTRVECRRYFGATTCPTLPETFPARIPSEPFRALAEPGAAGPLAGTRVTLSTPYDPIQARDLQEVLGRFTEATGIEVRLVGNPELVDYLSDSVAAGDPPDIAFSPQPGYMAEFARQADLMDLGSYLDIEQLRVDQSPYLVSLGTIAPDGVTWPSSDGTTFGAVVDLSVKSLIWYPVPEFQAAGYAVPKTWGELIALSDEIVADGRTPWCQGFLSGDAAGWPGTDWIEDLLLAGSGSAAYDDWTFHRIGFDSPPVREAFKHLGGILFTHGYGYRGPRAALDTGWDVAWNPMLERNPPECWLYHSPSFQARGAPSGSNGEFYAFAFPPITKRFSGGLIGGGSLMATFADRPEVRQVVSFLLSPEFGTEMAGFNLGFLSPNQRVDLDRYPDGWRQLTELLDASLAVDTFRWDGSDLMPSSIGEGRFWGAMMKYVRKGPESLDGILAELEAAWPDDS